MASIKKVIGKRETYYKITVSIGCIDGKWTKKNINYTPNPLTKTGKPRSEKSIMQEVEEYARKFEQECKEMPNMERRLTVKQLSERWLSEYCEMQLSPTSVISYRQHLEQRILPRFGTTKISEISPYSIQKFINDTFTVGERLDGKKDTQLSPSTVKKIYVTMSSMFSWAVYQGLMESNPCKNVKPVRQTRRTRDVEAWNADQARTFIMAMQEQKVATQFKLFFHIALFCGMRRGEIVALRWSDIDMTKNKIHVNHSVINTGGQIIEKEPKTNSSIRQVSFDNVCAVLLKQWQKEQLAYKNKLGSYWQGENFLFIQDNGVRMHPDTPHRKFKKIIRVYNSNHDTPLPEIPMHGLRHTYATLAIVGGVDVRTISSQLGHAKTSTTTDIYAQALEEPSVKAAATITRLVFGENVEKEDKEHSRKI